MDTILVVCYSYTGTTRRLARLLCSHQGWPLGEIVEEHPRSGAFGTLRCVLDSLLRRHPAVRYEGPDPADFHTVVLVSPVWMYRLAGPMRSFVARHREALRHVAVI
ncbi:MAG: flavodoxin, partial [Ramlibacter sp.]